MLKNKNKFKIGDLVKYRNEKLKDFDPGLGSTKTYGEIGIVCEAPCQWDRWDHNNEGVVYVNSRNQIILAHKKDLIKIG